MKHYTIYLSKTNELVATGSASACAEQLGMPPACFRSTVSNVRNGKNKKYTIYDNGVNIAPADQDMPVRVADGIKAKRMEHDYVITLRETGEVIATGSVQACADKLGMTRVCFQSTVSKVRLGQNKKYLIKDNAQVDEKE